MLRKTGIPTKYETLLKMIKSKINNSTKNTDKPIHRLGYKQYSKVYHGMKKYTVRYIFHVKILRKYNISDVNSFLLMLIIVLVRGGTNEFLKLA